MVTGEKSYPPAGAWKAGRKGMGGERRTKSLFAGVSLGAVALWLAALRGILRKGRWARLQNDGKEILQGPLTRE